MERRPVRIRIEKRIPIAAGMAGGSADAGAALRLVARAAGIEDDALLREIGAGLGADVAAQVRPRRYLATGAGERLTPLPPPAPYGVLVIPSQHELSTADVYREFDRQALPRDAADLAARLREVSTAAADLPDELIGNDLEPAARALCPEIDDALATAREVGAHHALVCGSGPTVIGLFADLRGARGAARACPSASRARSPSRRGGRCCEAGLDRLRRRAGRLPGLAPAPPRAHAAGRRRPGRRRPRSSTALASCTSRTSSSC